MKLHLGCGKRHILGDDWIHVDLANFPHIDYQHDIRTLPMFADNSIDLVYACHVLEYFDRQEAIEALREWRRVLRPDGVLRLSVPDFTALCGLYAATGDLSKVIGPLYGRMEIADDVLIYHRTVYDRETLSDLLWKVGFVLIRPWNWRETEHAEVDDFSQAYYPHMDKEHGLMISLNLEAVK